MVSVVKPTVRRSGATTSSALQMVGVSKAAEGGEFVFAERLVGHGLFPR